MITRLGLLVAQETAVSKGACRCGCTVMVSFLRDSKSDAPTWSTVPCPICSTPTSIATKGLASGHEPALLGFERNDGLASGGKVCGPEVQPAPRSAGAGVASDAVKRGTGPYHNLQRHDHRGFAGWTVRVHRGGRLVCL